MQNVRTILANGTIIRGRYLIVGLLSKGDGAAIYLVRDLYIKRHVFNFFALAEVVNLNKQERAQITLEAMLLRLLHHSSLPRIFQVFRDDRNGRVYILTEYIDGPNLEILRLRRQEKVFSLSQMLSIMAPIVDAVTYLHKQNPPIIHRNIHSTNIIVSKGSGKAVLVNFGLFKQYNSGSSAGAIRHCSPGYCAPEQYNGEISTRTDIYALGATCYSLLTGFVPADAQYRATQLTEKGLDLLVPVNQVKTIAATPTSEAINRAIVFQRMMQSDSEEVNTTTPGQRIIPAIPTPVAEAIQRAMSVDSAARFSTVEEFWEALTSQGEQQVPVAGKLLPLSPPVVVQKAIGEPTPMIEGEQASVAEKVTGEPTPIREKVVSRPTPISVPKPPHIPQVSRRSVLLLVSLILLLVLSIGIGTGFYTVSHHSPGLATPTAVVLHKVTPPANAKPTMTSASQPTVEPTPIPSPTPTLVPGGLVNIASSYSGTVYDIATGFSTKMTLTQIQESQGRITGYFNGLQVSGAFQGSVDASRHIQLTVTDAIGRIVLSFNGVVRLDNNVVGDYCNTDARGKCAGDSGIWSVSP